MLPCSSVQMLFLDGVWYLVSVTQPIAAVDGIDLQVLLGHALKEFILLSRITQFDKTFWPS